METSVRLEREGAVAQLVLDRPEKLNAIDDATLRRLSEVVDEVRSTPDVRAVVLRGEGRAFSPGADLDAVDELRGDPARFADFLERWHRTFDAIEALETPTIAAVHGLALAGGFELTLVCDFVVLAEDARIGDQHARYGLFPGGGSTQRLPRLIGRRRAMWLLLSGEPLEARTAWEAGLVNEVVPPEEVLPRAMEMAELLARRSPLASARIKRSVRLGLEVGLQQALGLERPVTLEHMRSEDAGIGIDAFQRRQEPRFTGR